MLKDILTDNRTCRTFDESRKVTKDELVSFVECARLTPSTANIQPLSYRLVYKPEEVKAVQPTTKWGGALPELHLPPEGHRPTAFIVICIDKEKFGDPSKFQRDIGICAMAISLAVHEKGLASCMIGAFRAEDTAKVLGLPENILPQLVIGIGKPDERREIVEAKGSTKYYRENGIHYVPKRPLSEIIIDQERNHENAEL